MNENDTLYQGDNKLLLQLTKGLLWNFDTNNLDYLRDKVLII